MGRGVEACALDFCHVGSSGQSQFFKHPVQLHAHFFLLLERHAGIHGDADDLFEIRFCLRAIPALKSLGGIKRLQVNRM